MAAGWFLCFRFPLMWVITGIGEPNRPFLDLHALLVARDAVRLGMDPATSNPLDPYNRPFIYTTWWLAFPSWGLGRKDTIWLGAGCVLLLLVTALAWLRPRSWRDGVVAGVVLLSPAFLLAANRANHDIIVFVMVSLGLVCFRRKEAAWQALGVMTFAVAAVLKYYPLVTLLLLLELRPGRRLWTGFALYAAVLLLAWPGLAAAFASASRNSPTPEWLYAFGAPILWRNFASTSQLGWVVLGAVALAGAAVMAWNSERFRADLSAGTPAAEREFICGAVMLVGVFFLGASYAYKLIFALWMIPWLRQPPVEAGERRWRLVTWGLLLTALWLEGLAAITVNLVAAPDSARALLVLKAALFGSNVVDWILIACLMRFLFVYVGRLGREFLAGRTVQP